MIALNVALKEPKVSPLMAALCPTDAHPRIGAFGLCIAVYDIIVSTRKRLCGWFWCDE